MHHFDKDVEEFITSIRKTIEDGQVFYEDKLRELLEKNPEAVKAGRHHIHLPMDQLSDLDLPPQGSNIGSLLIPEPEVDDGE